MGVKQLIAAIKEVVMRMIVIMLAVILVMIVASRNVEYELEQAALTEQVQVDSESQNP